MNERLKQIAIKAQVEHCISHVRLQEFAELIVRECASLAYDGPGGILDHFGLEEHFGVEE